MANGPLARFATAMQLGSPSAQDRTGAPTGTPPRTGPNPRVSHRIGFRAVRSRNRHVLEDAAATCPGREDAQIRRSSAAPISTDQGDRQGQSQYGYQVPTVTD